MEGGSEGTAVRKKKANIAEAKEGKTIMQVAANPQPASQTHWQS
jgi:hypothetical protein